VTISDQQYDEISQNAHVLGGSLAIMVAHLFWGMHGLLYAIPACVIVAALKEGVYDEIYEDPEVRGSSLRDFAFYGLGIVASSLVLVVHWAFTSGAL
jgi:hypothetical protein